MKILTPSALLPCVLGLVLPVGNTSAQSNGVQPFGVRVAASRAAPRVPSKTVTPNRARAPRVVSTPVRAPQRRSDALEHTNGRGRVVVGGVARGGETPFGRHSGRLGGYHIEVRSPRASSCGYWEVVRERVHVPAVYEWRYDACGRPYRVCVRHACYEWRSRRVYRSGCHASCAHSRHEPRRHEHRPARRTYRGRAPKRRSR